MPETWRQLTTSATRLLPPTAKQQRSGTSETTAETLAGRQLILPLLYEDSVMGLLVTGRQNRDWQERELKQIEKIS